MPQDIRQWIHDNLFEQVPINISVIDRGFHIVEANRSFAETYGDWVGRPCYEMYKDRSERCDRCAAAATFADGNIRVREERGVDRLGRTMYYLVHMVPLIHRDGAIPYIIEMSTDITANKQLELEKIEAERLAAVGQTVAGLAHGIKNVIMGLEGGMYVVGSGIKRNKPERVSQGWAMLEENIERISVFVREFLEFARGRKAKVLLVDPNAIAGKVIDLFRDRAAMSHIELKADLQDNIAVAPMDPEGIHTCLSNLVSNAIDACEMSQKGGLRVILSVRETDGVLTYEVSDDGCGMDYDIKQKVFSNFFSTKGSGKGTGLGLLTTRKIVQEHGGNVSFESTEGVGSVFRLEFTRARLLQPSEGGEQ